MINTLRGKVLSIGEESITLEVAGFGLEVFATRSLMSQAELSEELFCYAYMQISDAGVSLSLFDERERLLIL
jgi:Holliday junction DNA helicase RuvA